MMHFNPSLIHIADYDYLLPEERIAKYPLLRRDASKLLVYKDGLISDRKFTDLPDALPEHALMVFNNTRVVPARLFFTKPTGAVIEIFCLEPVLPCDYVSSFASVNHVTWRCVVGNAKKWKEGPLELYNPDGNPDLAALHLQAVCLEKEKDTSLVHLSWESGRSFAEVMEYCGKVPIPPYLKREAESGDKERYQTVYAHFRGSVAAPTAGLHFTPRVLQDIDQRGFLRQELTLHVGAGTFKPVKSDTIDKHVMHSEPFSMTRDFLQALKDHDGPIVAVGTTSCRCLESLYYFARQIHHGKKPEYLSQWEAYREDGGPEMTTKESLQVILDYMDREGLATFHARTQIFIVPSFTFRLVNALVTNYHQPQSTLLLLVAALIGTSWREVYAHALAGGYRFLSYGDSSLLYGRCE